MPQHQGCAGSEQLRARADATYLAACGCRALACPGVCAPVSRYRVGTVRVGHYLQVHVSDALQRGCGVDVSEEEQPWLGWGLGLG